MSSYGGRNYQLPVSQYLPPSGSVQQGLGTSFAGANDLYNLSNFGSPLSIQNQLGTGYQPIADYGMGRMTQMTPLLTNRTDAAANMGTNAAAMASGTTNQLFNLGGLTADQGTGLFAAGKDLLNRANPLYKQGSNVLNAQLGQMSGLQGYADQALQTGFDPQNALFNRTAQQMRDVLGASSNAAGLGSSPYGANLQSEGMKNFLLDWQNQALQRQQTGAATAGSLYNTMGNLPAAAEGIFNIGQGLTQSGLAADQTGVGMQQSGLGLDQGALSLGQGATSLANTAAGLPLAATQNLLQGELGVQDALAQAKTNMFNQRASGVNAIDQYLKSATGILGTDISAQQQNLNASENQFGNQLGIAGLGLQMMGK